MSRGVLRGSGADATPSRLMLNKMDRAYSAERAELLAKQLDAIPLSAHSSVDVSALRGTIIAFFEEAMVKDVLVLRYAREEVIGEVCTRVRGCSPKPTTRLGAC